MPQASFDAAIKLFEQGKLANAAKVCADVIRAQPHHLGALDMLSVIELQNGRYERALRIMDRALAAGRNDPQLHVSRGMALWRLKRSDEALASYERALAADPKHFDAYCIRGNALHELRRFDDAIADYDRALAVTPHHPGALYNRANSLRAAGRLQEALRDFDETLVRAPNFPDAHHNRGILLAAQRNFGEALESFDKAIALKPDHIDAFCGRANALRQLGRLDEAVAILERAIALRPDHAEAHRSCADILLELRRLEEAFESYDRAATLRPDLDYLLGDRLFVKMKICDWRGIERDMDDLATKAEQGKKVCQPLILLAINDRPNVQRVAAETWMTDKCPVREVRPAGPSRGNRKIRIGYFSADFREHAMGYLLAGVYEHHDKSTFEIVGFSFSTDPASKMLARIKPAFDEFIDVSDMPDAAVAQLARSRDIDIAVDLMGFTRGGRAGVFAAGAAPIQVNYLGYPGTMGADFFDYILADPTLIPEASQTAYSETIIRLPHCYQANDDKRRISETTFTRSDLGLPDSGFVFCCFNNSHKITPGVFDSWMRILQRIDGSVLWLLEDNVSATRNLRQEAERRGVSADRLVFGGRMPLEQHLARHRTADLFLDTLPYNAHTTASDALWAGLPIVTCAGESFAGRVAASLLNAVGLPELVTTTREDYEDLAVRLAADPALLGQFKSRLERNRFGTPLFNTAQFTRDLESAFVQMITDSGSRPA